MTPDRLNEGEVEWEEFVDVLCATKRRASEDLEEQEFSISISRC
jgi:hypothetical protein